MADLIRPPSIFEGPQTIEVEPGTMIRKIVDDLALPPDLADRVVVILNGHAIQARDVAIRAGDSVGVAIVPAGGDSKQTLASVAMIAVAFAAPYAAGALLPSTVAAGSLVYTGVTAGITMLGQMAISALIPPPSPSTSGLGGNTASSVSAKESRTYSFQGQSNAARFYETVPMIYGEHRFFPNLATTPLVENVGKSSTLTSLYDFGIGDLELSDIRVGDLSASQLDPDMVIHRNSLVKNPRLATRRVGYDQFSFVVDRGNPFTVRTKPDATRATIDITFPGGLVRFDGSERRIHSAEFRVEYRPASGGSWTVVSANAYKGIGSKNSNNPILTSEYGYSGGKADDNGTRWQVWTHTRSSGEVREILQIWRNGRLRYTSPQYKVGAAPSATTVGGKRFRRGAARDQWSEAEESWQAYELIVEIEPSNNTVTLRAKTAESITASVEMRFPSTGTYDVRVTRISPTSTENTFRDESVVTLLKSFTGGNVVDLQHRHTMFEFRLEATDKVSGTIQNLNAIAMSNLRGVNAAGWTDKRPTGNNALVALDILAGEGARIPLADDQIDFPSFNRLRQICDTTVTNKINGVTYTSKKHAFNGVFDATYTTKEALDAVLAPARATISIMDNGKIGVVIDEEQDTPRQLITPANSWAFSGQRAFSEIPHALRVQFIEPETNYGPAEIIVYRDGFSQSNATIFEDLRSFGITEVSEAWRYGRFMLAQGIHRSESFTLTMDVENLAVQRGDLVTVQHDVPQFGGMAARVIDAIGPMIHLDRPFGASVVDGYTVRLSDGTVRTGAVTGTGTDANIIEVDDPTGIDEGDLIVIGQFGNVTRDYIVTGIEPGADLTAVVHMVRYEPAVYSVDTDPIPPWNPGFGEDLIAGTDLAAVNPTATQFWEFVDRVPIKVVRLTWEITGNLATYDSAFVQMIQEGFDVVDVGRSDRGALTLDYRVPITDTAKFLDPLVFTIQPRNTLGAEGTPTEIAVQLSPYDLKPAPPTRGFLDVRGRELSIFWEYSISPDVVRYVIRYTPDTLSPSWSGAQHLGRVDYQSNEFATGARTGSYIIRAQNFSGVMSDPVVVRTTIETLPDINVVETVNDAPLWPGQKTNFIVENDPAVVGVFGRDVLATNPAWTAGDDPAIYTIKGFRDLGDIYEVLIQDRSEGLIVPKSEYPQGIPARVADVAVQDVEMAWDYWLEYSAIAETNVMSQWPVLSSLGMLAVGNSQWSPWRKVRVGLVTGRIFRFRFVAISDNDENRIVITDGEIQIDMPDRTWRKMNVPISAAGTTVLFDPAFAAPPVLAVTIEGQGNAVTYRATALTRTSATIELLDETGAPVAGQIDIAALGYGKQKGDII